MLEALVLCFAGLLAIAATTYRLRGASGATTAQRRIGLRVFAAVALSLALVRAGGTIDGERIVRFLAVLTLAGVALVLLLSERQELAMRPIRRIFRDRP